jgi:hypothetical protein
LNLEAGAAVELAGTPATSFLIDAISSAAWGLRRRRHAHPGRHPITVDRIDRRKPQVLQRAFDSQLSEPLALLKGLLAPFERV